MVGDVCLKAWRTTQTVVALSNGDAEYCVAVMGAIENLCLMAGGADVGQWNHGSVWVSGQMKLGMIVGKDTGPHADKMPCWVEVSGIRRAPGFCVEGGRSNIVEASWCVLGAGGSQPDLGGSEGDCCHSTQNFDVCDVLLI